MYEAAAIARTTGAEGLAYAQNKNRGGRSSAKGRDFEVLYGAHRIALAAAEAWRTGSLGVGITFHDQVLSFVDDFIETRPDGRTLEQLKSGAAAWSGGDHPLADDFRLQMKLDAACGINADYRLVVSDEVRRASLVDNRPDDLAKVAVCRFPEGLKDQDLIGDLRDLADALAVLSPRPSERIVREQVWRMLVGVWAQSRGDQRLADLVNQAAEGPGGVVAPMLPPFEMPTDAKKALDKIAGFRFYIDKNFFGYEWGYARGYAEYHCHTPEFGAFLTDLVVSQPIDFYAFFAVLKAHV